MKHAYTHLLKTLVLLGCVLCMQATYATITVDSVHITTSNCPNNGTARVFARSNHSNAVFLFNLVSGPVIYPEQNDSTFHSLYSGNYSGWVHDVNSFDSTQFTFTITGSYETPVVSISGSSPLCLNSSTGQIIGSIQPGTGLAPYQWQIYSPYTGPEQQSSTFNNLGAGSYIIRLTDACNVSRSVSIALDTGGTGLLLGPYEQEYTRYFACGTVAFTAAFSIYISKAYLPYTLTETTSTGTVSKQIYPIVYDTVYSNPPLYTFNDTITGVDFYGPLRVSLTDICGVTITFQPTTFQPFVFQFQPLTDSCGATAGTIVAEDSAGVFYDLNTNDLMPLHVTVQNAQTLQLVDSFTTLYFPALDRPCNTCPLFQPQPPNQNFILTVTDGCRDTSVQTFSWPQQYAATCTPASIPSSCRDSCGSEIFGLYGFGATVNLTFLSGPPVAESSSPLFGYQRQLFYPATLNGLSNTSNQVDVSNLPPGFYTYNITDLCGHSITDTFTMAFAEGLYINAPVNSNCNGTSNIEISLPVDEDYLYVYNLNNHDTAHISIYDYEHLMVYNRPPGTYAVSIRFVNYRGPAIPGNPGCSYAIDTVVVPNYNDSIIKSTYTAFCNGDIYLIVVADTSNGPPPFAYEVLNGPQTFPPQSTGLFQVNAWGTYLIGALDSCGNEDTRYVTVDTGRILPVVRSGGLCAGGTVALYETASPYFAYKWVTPDGRVYHGSSIVINPFTTADTGLVHITQYVTVNGCTDSATGTYYLSYNDTFYNRVSMCANDTLFVGNNFYTQAGTYTDNLTGVYGCDSVVVSIVHMKPALQITITAQPVDSCASYYTQLTASGGTNYVWQPGNLTEPSIQVFGPYGSVFYVTAYDTGICYTTDSVVVYSFPFVWLSNDLGVVCNKTPVQICASITGVTYLWSNGSTAQCISTLNPGYYTVTVTSSSGCTAVSETGQVVNDVPPVIVNRNDTLFCITSDSFIYNTYQWTLDDSAITGANDTMYVVPVAGTYNCIVQDSLFCTATSNPISFVTGVTHLQGTADVSILPNPTTGKLVIKTQNFNAQSIAIYDDAGRLISTSAFKTEIDITTLTDGVYFVEITGNEGVLRKGVVKM